MGLLFTYYFLDDSHTLPSHGRVTGVQRAKPMHCLRARTLLLIRLFQQATGCSVMTSITISPGTATGIGLASAAQYQVLSDAQWVDYERVVGIVVLNGIPRWLRTTGSR
jgi:hypothetical protein